MRKSILACFMFILSQSLSAQNDTFKLCGDQKTYPYYNPDLKYQGGFYEIKSELRRICYNCPYYCIDCKDEKNCLSCVGSHRVVKL